jgi:hypothetical protein
MDPNRFHLPEGEYVASLPTGVDRIWKILWSVDPARVKVDPGVYQKVWNIVVSHQITVSQSLAALHTAEAKALQDIANVTKFG